MTAARVARTVRWPRSLPWSRVIGLRSLYAKTVKDSRRAALVVGLVAGGFMFGTGAPYGSAPEFSTIVLRHQFIAGLTALPLAIRGLLGEPINVETLGGFLSWRIGNTLVGIFGLWSVLALSGTLAAEITKGSLDLVASGPSSRYRIAFEKVAGHITAVAFAMLLAAVITWWVGSAFAKLPGDEIPLTAALGQFLLYGLLMVAAGSVSFATAMAVGRTRAVGLGLLALFGGYLIESYASLSPLIAALRPLSWYSWTVGHRPMAGVTDWPSLALLASVATVLLGVGIVSFARRDIGVSDGLAWLRLPSLPAGIGGPFRRQLADRAGIAVGWGVAMGLYAGFIVASADAFATGLGSLPQIVDLIRRIYPGVDIREPSGVLQLTFFAFGSFILGLAGAAILVGWASDEGSRRLDLILTTPLSRGRWAAWSGLGVLAAVALATVVLAAFTGCAVAIVGGDVVTPVAGTAVLGLSAAAFAGVGLAAGGLVRSSLAPAVAAGVVIATFLIDTLGAALKLPDAILQLSLYSHLGQPMAGTFDAVGLVAAAILAVGGLAIGTWGMTRRDVGR
jgi:ABC-2 type transport system permease protein